jgi:hypothetical protein
MIPINVHFDRLHILRKKFFKRAFIVRFRHTADLIELVLKLKLPNQKTVEVKGNREYRIFAESEFHACREVLKMGVKPETIESIYRYKYSVR